VTWDIGAPLAGSVAYGATWRSIDPPFGRVSVRVRHAARTAKTPFIPAAAGIQARGLGPRFRGDERKRVFEYYRANCGGAVTAAWIALQWRTRLAWEETNCLSGVLMS